ncbi:porin [Aliiroseovarius sp. PrR006]|uniref:porin n=1 Tax=Aliiroseovarius sp. PrR006 TaxID=2706883 RepID=UPI0013D36501|nr:porin [Aliiroseovarius sp. PrR006]NDW54478.1 porin [Aliiroseovarius sp. PrR006]
MKKILFASTALVASAGFAAAEVSFSGAAGFGLTYDGSDWNPDYYTTLSVSMTGETDGGLSFGADYDITQDNGAIAVGDTEVHVEGGFGKLTVGAVGSASDAKLGLGDIGYSGLGTDNVAEVLIDGADSGNIMYTGSFGDFGVALSYDMQGTEIFSVVATYAMGDYNFGIGYDDWGNVIPGGSAFHVKAGGNFGDVALNALYSRSSFIDTNTFGVTAGYTMGAATITAAYSSVSVLGVTGDVYGLGVSYDLGGGASIDAGVADNGTTTVADLGINMSF